MSPASSASSATVRAKSANRGSRCAAQRFRPVRMIDSQVPNAAPTSAEVKPVISAIS